jgi:hypothetical protein
VGRLFVSTDTFEIYRDTGTGWDLIGGPGSSTVTGSGAAGQVTYWTGSNSVSGENNLWWDAATNHLGINTITPGAALDIHSGADVGMQLNGTGATPSILQAFLSAGVSQYEIGYNWNSDINYRRFSIYDSQGSKEVISIDQQSRFVGINYQYSSLADQPAYTLDVSGSGRFTDNAYFDSSGTGFVGINTVTQLGKMNIVSDGAAEANLYLTRYNSVGSHLLFLSAAGTKTVPTAIQNGNELGKISFNGYNGSNFNNTTGIITAEAVENFTTLAQGTSLSFATTPQGSTNPIKNIYFDYNGNIARGTTVSAYNGITIQENSSSVYYFSKSGNVEMISGCASALGQALIATVTNHDLTFYTNNTVKTTIKSNGNFLIGTTTDAGQKLQVNGDIKTGAPTTGTAGAWKLGSRVAATVVVNTTEYIEVDIGGTLYKLATVT